MAMCVGAAAAARTHQRMRVDLNGPGALEQFELQDAASWSAENGTVRLHTAGKPEGPIRKPSRWAILKTEPWGDVSFRTRVRSDAPVERKGRDVLIFFGYQSPTRFYYVHLSNETTATHNGIFLVKDADRKRIDEPTGVPKLMDAEWHDVRVERNVDKGTIEVYFDREAEPFLVARDKALKEGRVGVGSFDDPAAFADLVVQGTAAD